MSDQEVNIFPEEIVEVDEPLIVDEEGDDKGGLKIMVFKNL